jgi:hypothetical protein
MTYNNSGSAYSVMGNTTQANQGMAKSEELGQQ